VDVIRLDRPFFDRPTQDRRTSSGSAPGSRSRPCP
jgi:hypothetical protein